MWVRGLKHINILLFFWIFRVAPYVGAWIETRNCHLRCADRGSHPMWVRGLKLVDDGNLPVCNFVAPLHREATFKLIHLCPAVLIMYVYCLLALRYNEKDSFICKNEIAES